MDPTVVVVDDTPDIRMLVSLHLRFAGWEVVGTGETGHDAVRLAADLLPTVMVLDHSMPGLSGVDAIPAIRRSSPRTCIVMFSAVDLTLHLAHAERLPDLVIPKGQGAGGLASAVAGHLADRRSETAH